jgi:hypothetical protein
VGYVVEHLFLARHPCAYVVLIFLSGVGRGVDLLDLQQVRAYMSV